MRVAIPSSVAIAAVVAGVLAAPAPVAAQKALPCQGGGVQPETVAPEAFGDTVLCLLNRERAKRGEKPLRMDSRLGEAADGHSASMRSRSYFSHDDPSGEGFDDRIIATGYTQGARRWLIGENIAWGSDELGTPGALVNAWMHSPPHRANILEAKYRQIGVGVVWGTPDDSGAPDAAIITTDFGFVKFK